MTETHIPTGELVSTEAYFHQEIPIAHSWTIIIVIKETKDEEGLERKLESSSLDFKVEDFKMYIKDFNSKLAGNQGEEAQEELLSTLEHFENELKPNNSGMATTSSAGKTVCSGAMAAVGLSNSTVIGVGALALGLSGPAGLAALGAATATSAMWSGASLVACQ